MLPVEIHTIQNAVILRARGSELLILAEHVTQLKSRKTAKEFADYFLADALVNRPARKLFEAWLRKDGSLWARIYKAVQTAEQSTEDAPEVKNDRKTKETVISAQAEEKGEKKSPAKKVEKAAATPKKAAAAKPEKTAKKADVKKAPVAAKKASKAAAPARKAPTKSAGRSSGK